MLLNPIVKKDVKVQSRSMRICWGVFAYELILALTFFLAMVLIEQQSRYSTSNIYSAMVWLYPVPALTQLGILGLIVPVRTASAISGEKERQTFDIMMTTSMTPFAIIAGKVMTAMVQSMFFVIASMPVMALAFVIGGMSWGYLFAFLAIALLVSLFSASIGILCSSICKKSISAVIMSYGIYIVFFIGTVLPYVLYEVVTMNAVYNANGVTVNPAQTYNYGANMYLFLLFNPAVYLAEFFVRVMTGESMVNTIPTLTGTAQTRGLINHVAVGNRWMIISTILFVGISLLFLWIASKRIHPIKRRARKRAAKQTQQAQVQQMQQVVLQTQVMQQPQYAQQGVQPQNPQQMMQPQSVQQGIQQPMQPQQEYVPQQREMPQQPQPMPRSDTQER